MRYGAAIRGKPRVSTTRLNAREPSVATGFANLVKRKFALAKSRMIQYPKTWIDFAPAGADLSPQPLGRGGGRL